MLAGAIVHEQYEVSPLAGAIVHEQYEVPALAGAIVHEQYEVPTLAGAIVRNQTFVSLKKRRQSSNPCVVRLTGNPHHTPAAPHPSTNPQK